MPKLFFSFASKDCLLAERLWISNGSFWHIAFFESSAISVPADSQHRVSDQAKADLICGAAASAVAVVGSTACTVLTKGKCLPLIGKSARLFTDGLLKPYRRAAAATLSNEVRTKVRKGIEDSIPEFLREMAKKGWAVDEANFRKASELLTGILEKNGIQAETVTNGIHVFVKYKDFYGPGEDLFVDGTIRQFFRPPQLAPKVFIGSKQELENLLEKTTIKDQFLEFDWFNLRSAS